MKNLQQVSVKSDRPTSGFHWYMSYRIWNLITIHTLWSNNNKKKPQQGSVESTTKTRIKNRENDNTMNHNAAISRLKNPHTLTYPPLYQT